MAGCLVKAFETLNVHCTEGIVYWLYCSFIEGGKGGGVGV